MDETITYVGLDVHKETIAVALAEGGGRGDARAFGQIVNTPTALARMLAKLSQPGRTLKFCYEAGPCGYSIQRQLSAAGYDCVVVAPSLIPRKPGDRIKTDRRDANNLARLHRAGELSAVWIPDKAHEAMRDLVRLCAACGKRASSSADFCFVMAFTTAGRPGHRCTAVGWPVFALNSQSTKSFSRTTSPPSRRQLSGGIG